MKFILILFFALFPIAFDAHAEIITAIGVDEPPQSYYDPVHGLQGISVDIAKEVLARIGSDDKIDMMPWARAKMTAMTEPNILAFTVSRSEEREDKFHWIMEINKNIMGLYALCSRNVRLQDLEAAKRVERIGVQRGDVREEHLRKLGFENLEPGSSHKQIVRKLLSGRLDLVYMAPTAVQMECSRLGVSASQLELVAFTQPMTSYLVLSKPGTSPEMVQKIREVAEAVKNDGTRAKICRKWESKLAQEFMIDVHCGPDGVLRLYPKDVKIAK